MSLPYPRQDGQRYTALSNWLTNWDRLAMPRRRPGPSSGVEGRVWVKLSRRAALETVRRTSISRRMTFGRKGPEAEGVVVIVVQRTEPTKSI
jgi:hypothetical protein